jgi:G6PDH family F420-dependent oxidoreductase
VDVIRALWRGETVTHFGRVQVQEARLFTLPTAPPKLFAAAISQETAEFAGGWADGLMMVGGPSDTVAKMIDAFRRGGGEGKPVYVQHALSWAPTEGEARRGGHEQWRFSVLGGEVLPMLRTPEQFAAAAQFVTADDVAQRIRISADLGRHAEWLHDYVELGVDTVYLFNVNRHQREFIDAFAAKVLPEVAAAAR